MVEQLVVMTHRTGHVSGRESGRMNSWVGMWSVGKSVGCPTSDECKVLSEFGPALQSVPGLGRQRYTGRKARCLDRDDRDKSRETVLSAGPGRDRWGLLPKSRALSFRAMTEKLNPGYRWPSRPVCYPRCNNADRHSYIAASRSRSPLSPTPSGSGLGPARFTDHGMRPPRARDTPAAAP